MQLTKPQKIYIFTSALFIAAIIAIPLLKLNLRSSQNGDTVKPELANLKEVGKTRILEGTYKNATISLKLKYEDSRRHKFFEQAISESWGFDKNSYHVFVLEADLYKVSLQTLPNGKEIPSDKLQTFEILEIIMNLSPQNLNNVQINNLTLTNPSQQGALERNLQSQPIKLNPGEITSRYIFFEKKFEFSDIQSATLKLPNGETITLEPKEIEYPIPPTVPGKN